MRGLAFFIIGVLIIFGVYKVTDNKSQQQKSKQAVESQLNEGLQDELKQPLENEALEQKE